MEFMICFAGILLGEFLNSCIHRLPQSWIMSSGVMPEMAKGTRRFFLMGLTGSSLVFVYGLFGFHAELLRAVFFLSFLIIIAMIDYDHQLVLDKVLLVMGASGIILQIFCMAMENAVVFEDVSALSILLIDRIIGFFTGGVLLLFIAVISGGGMGGGDVKLAAVLGLWFGWQFILLTLLLSFFLGGIVGAGLVLAGIKGRKDYIPFAPFIAIAAFVSYLYGDVLIYLYVSWIL